MQNARPGGPCPEVELVELRTLRFDLSPRLTGENTEHTKLLAEVAAELLPPILVHRETMRVIDGRHRAGAARLRGERAVRAEFFSGSEESAFLLAVEANRAHGLPLSLTERKAAAVRIACLFPDRSDRSIAASTGLSDKTVAKLRRPSAEGPRVDARLGSDGRIRPVDSAARRRRAAQLLARQPKAPLREIARAVGISPTTVLDVRRRLARGEDPVPLGARGASSPVKPAPQQAPDQPDARHDLHTLLHSLRSDPAFKSSEAGRELLRWLHSQVVNPEHRDALLRDSPPHCFELIASLADIYSKTWETLAQQLRCRSGGS